MPKHLSDRQLLLYEYLAQACIAERKETGCADDLPPALRATLDLAILSQSDLKTTSRSKIDTVEAMSAAPERLSPVEKILIARILAGAGRQPAALKAYADFARDEIFLTPKKFVSADDQHEAPPMLTAVELVEDVSGNLDEEYTQAFLNKMVILLRPGNMHSKGTRALYLAAILEMAGKSNLTSQRLGGFMQFAGEPNDGWVLQNTLVYALLQAKAGNANEASRIAREWVTDKADSGVYDYDFSDAGRHYDEANFEKVVGVRATSPSELLATTVRDSLARFPDGSPEIYAWLKELARIIDQKMDAGDIRRENGLTALALVGVYLHEKGETEIVDFVVDLLSRRLSGQSDLSAAATSFIVVAFEAMKKPLPLSAEKAFLEAGYLTMPRVSDAILRVAREEGPRQALVSGEKSASFAVNDATIAALAEVAERVGDVQRAEYWNERKDAAVKAKTDLESYMRQHP